MREIDFGLSNLEHQTPEPSQNISHSIIREGGEIKSGEENHQILPDLVNLAKIEDKQRVTEQKGKDSVNKTKKTSWEPFNKEPTSAQRFVNLYGGAFSQQMELNRQKAEELIKVAAFEGQVVLTSLSPTRTRSIEANPDGSVTAKRRLFWGEKPIEDEENPNFRVASISEGWEIEICDQKILEELQEKFAGEKLQKKFVTRFNQHLRAGIWQSICREKLTSEKYKVIGRIIDTLLPTGFLVFVSIVSNTPAWYEWLIFQPVGYSMLNILGRAIRFIKQDTLYRRSLQSIYEYFMPEVEIDRVLRGLSYLNLKGRNLVRLR